MTESSTAGTAHANGEDAAPTGARTIVHHLLRGGLAIAIALMLAGLVVKLASGDHRNEAVKLLGLQHAPSLGDALMGAGILALGLTPAVRVLVLAVVWTREHDWRFVGVALAVVATLTTAVLLGGG